MTYPYPPQPPGFRRPLRPIRPPAKRPNPIIWFILIIVLGLLVTGGVLLVQNLSRFFPPPAPAPTGSEFPQWPSPSILTKPSETWTPLSKVDPTVPAPPQINPDPRWTVADVDLHGSNSAQHARVDGFLDGSELVDAGGVWLFVTADRQSNGVPSRLTAINSTTGEKLWARPMSQVYCASELLGGKAVCAHALKTDPASGLGTRWRFELIDPASGNVTLAADRDAWITGLFITGNRVGILEQRLPAPHVVVTLLDAGLKPAKIYDLGGDKRIHYSNDRIVTRYPMLPPGPALQNPRVVHFSHNLTVLWSVGTTIYLDDVTGKLITILNCERPVDDGKRIWCNTNGQAIAHNYSLKELYRTAPTIRLQQPNHDLNADSDVTDPVFIDKQGRLMRVDLASGKTLGTLLPTGTGKVLGMTTKTDTWFSQGVTFSTIGGFVVALDARSGKALWDVQMESLDGVAAWGSSVILYTTGHWLVVDKETGHVWQDLKVRDWARRLMVRDDAVTAIGLNSVSSFGLA